MFTIADEPTFTHDVIARVPVDGGFEDQTFGVTYRVLPVEELEAYNLDTVEGSSEFLEKVVKNLDGIVDEKKKKLTFNDELLKKVVARPYGRAALLRGYISGVSGARSGN